MKKYLWGMFVACVMGTVFFLASSTAGADEPPLSSIALPIRLPLKTMLDKINEMGHEDLSFPFSINEETSHTAGFFGRINGTIHLALNRLEDFQIVADNDKTLVIKTLLHLGLQGGGIRVDGYHRIVIDLNFLGDITNTTHLGRADASLNASGIAEVSLVIDLNGAVEGGNVFVTFPNLRNVIIDWKEGPFIRADIDFKGRLQPLDIFGVDNYLERKIREKVGDYLRDAPQKITAIANKYINEYAAGELQRFCASNWESLFEPQELAKSLWLAASPQAVSLSPFKIVGDVLESTVAIDAGLQCYVGSGPPALTSKDILPLPRLVWREFSTRHPISVFNVEVLFPYSEIERRLKTMEGATIPLKSRSVTLNSISLDRKERNFFLLTSLDDPDLGLIPLNINLRIDYGSESGVLSIVEDSEQRTAIASQLLENLNWPLKQSAQVVVALINETVLNKGVGNHRWNVDGRVHEIAFRNYRLNDEGIVLSFSADTEATFKFK